MLQLLLIIIIIIIIIYFSNFIQVNIEEKKYEQVGLIEMVEALSSKYAEHCVNQPFLRCFDTILESYV